jgi:hypothetical protein
MISYPDTLRRESSGGMWVGTAARVEDPHSYTRADSSPTLEYIILDSRTADRTTVKSMPEPASDL